LRVETRETGNMVILSLYGNIRTNDDYTAFKEAMDGMIEKGKIRIILNFKEVHFINSSGLGRLVLAAKKLKELTGALGIVNLSDDLKELFLFTRLDTKIPIFPTEDDAIAGL
jgi:anti-sigma B factor antagonist